MKYLLLIFILCSCHYRQSEYVVSEGHVSSVKNGPLKSFEFKSLESRAIQGGEFKKVSLKAHENLILESDRFINLRLYIHEQGSRPLLIIQPISRGKYRISTYVAKSFYDRGWNTLIVERENKYKKLYEPEKINLQMRELVIDSRQIVDWLYFQNDFHVSDIAMFGISKGGIKTSLILADDPRIKAALIALAGGDLPSILSESNERGVSRVRKYYMQRHGVSENEFKQVLERSFTVDPLKSAHKIDGRKIMHILAYFDKSVPYSYGLKLYEAMPGASSYTVLAGHYSAILFLPFILNRTEAFFNKTLNLNN